MDPLLSKIKTLIVNPIIGLLFAIALLIFLYGIVEFILNANNAEGRANGRRHMIWGIIGLFIVTAVFGLMNLLASFWK